MWVCLEFFWAGGVCRLGSLFISLLFFSSSPFFAVFFPDRERLQRCLVLEWLQGKPKCLTCIFYLLCCLFPDLHTSPCTFYLNFFEFISEFLPLSSVYCPLTSPSVYTPFIFPIFLYVLICCFPLSFLHHFFLSFCLPFFLPSPPATCLSLQDGAVHP